MFVAGAADVAGEGGVDEFLIVAGVVAERGDDDGGEIVPRRFDCRSKRLDVVVPELDEMGTVLRYHPGESRYTPWGSAMVGTLSDEHFPTSGAIALPWPSGQSLCLGCLAQNSDISCTLCPG